MDWEERKNVLEQLHQRKIVTSNAAGERWMGRLRVAWLWIPRLKKHVFANMEWQEGKNKQPGWAHSYIKVIYLCTASNRALSFYLKLCLIKCVTIDWCAWFSILWGIQSILWRIPSSTVDGCLPVLWKDKISTFEGYHQYCGIMPFALWMIFNTPGIPSELGGNDQYCRDANGIPSQCWTSSINSKKIESPTSRNSRCTS